MATVAASDKVVVRKILDKIKWARIDDVYYVHPDHIEEFEARHGPLI